MCVRILLYMCAQLAEERRRRAVLKSPPNYLRVRILLCVSSYILLYVRPHTITSVPSYYYVCYHTIMCALILPLLFLSPLRHFIVVHSTRLASLKNFNYYIFFKELQLTCNSYTIICVLILLYKCPHNTIYMSAYCYMCPHTNVCVSAYYYICVLILPYMCPHECIFFLRLLYVCPPTIICVLILLYACPPTDIGVLTLIYMCPHACKKTY
jgi:hypothetical protein